MRMSESASATITSTQLGPDSYSYTVTLTDTGSTPLGTFWMGWVPGKDFLDTRPTSASDPTGWTDAITNFGASDGYAIQWHVVSTSTDEVPPGGSLSFSFTSADTPAEVFGDSTHYPGTPALTSFVYSGMPFSDGGFQLVVEPACFLAGTHIRTDRGEVPVETLRPGDTVMTASGAARKLRWIGTGRTLITPRNRDRATPVVVRRHALGECVPHRDLHITRGHSLFIDGVLIPVEELVNHRSIAWDDSARVVEFFHLELDSHDVVIAEGAAAETFRDDANSDTFHNFGTRPPTPAVPPCAPVLHDHPTVKKIWRRLSDRAGRLELPLTDESGLHLLADGIRIDTDTVECGVWRFRLSAPATELRVVSRSAIPSMLGIAQDQRRLGVALRRIVLRQQGMERSLDWHSPLFGPGFHAPEPAERHRWTDGDAALPAGLLAGFAAGATIELDVCGTLRYPLALPRRAQAA
jgi:Hint domain